VVEASQIQENTPAPTKKKRRWLWWLTIPGFLVTLLLLLQLHAVQSFLAKRVAAYLSSEWNRKVQIDEVSVDLWARFVLRGFYVEDHHGDTLIYAQELRVASYAYAGNKNQFSTQSIELSNPVIHLKRYANESDWNYQFLSDYFTSSEPKDTTAGTDLWIGRLTLSDGSFQFDDANTAAPASAVFDANHIFVKHLNLQASDIFLGEKHTLASVDHLQFTDRSGFTCDDMHVCLHVDDKQMDFSGLKLKTGSTEFNAEMRLFVNDTAQWNDFANQVQWDGKIAKSVFVPEDFSAFLSDLNGFSNTMEIFGQVSGTLNQLHLAHLVLETGRKTKFDCSATVYNLAQLDSLWYDAQVHRLATDYTDLMHIPNYPFAEKQPLPLPHNIEALGLIDFKGRVKGGLEQVSVDGEVFTEIGNLKTQLDLYNFSTKLAYRGKLDLSKFQLNTYYATPDLGILSANLDIEGSGVNISDLNLNFGGNIQELGLLGYTYTGITSKGLFKNKFFEGEISIEDKNADMVFEGKIDFSQKKPILDFDMDVLHYDLQAVNLLEDDEPIVLKGGFSAHLKGLDINEISGELTGSNIDYLKDGKHNRLDYFTLDAEQGEERVVTLNSDVIFAQLNGKFSWKELGSSVQDIVAEVLPNFQGSKREHKSQKFDLKVRIQDFNFVSAAFLPELKIARGTSLNLSLNEEANELNGTIGSNFIQYEDYRLDGLTADIQNEANALYVTLGIEKIQDASSTYVNNFAWDLRSFGDTVFSALTFGNDGEVVTGDLNGVFFLHSFNDFSYRVGQSHILLNGKRWDWKPNAVLNVCGPDIAMHNFKMYNGFQFLGIDGSVGHYEGNILGVELANIQLAELNPLLGDAVQLGGEVTGKVELSHVYDKMRATSEMNIFDLGVNGIDVGNVCLNSSWDSKRNTLRADGEVEKDGLNPLRFAGNYYPEEKEESLDFLLTLNNFDLEILNTFLGPDVLGVHGHASTMLSLTGSTEEPQIKGDIQLLQTKIFVPYLQTTFLVNDKIHVEPDMFALTNVKILDEENNVGRITGQVFHTNFSDFSYDLAVDMEKPMLVMDTKEEDNSDFYGKAYCTGFLNISGYGEQTEFDMVLKSERGTVFNLPMSSSSDLQFDTYIRFVNPNAKPDSTALKADLSGIKLNMQLDVTEDAEFQIIFDEGVGDVMRGRGKGHLSMVINNLSTFNMYGMLEITQGDYLFTLMNLVNKPFAVKPGGIIAWYGDPMGGELDMQAVYRVSASLSDVVPDPTQTSGGKRVPVNLIMNLQGKMLNPTVGFDIELPQSDQLTKSRVASVISTEQERNRQAFALLVMGRFVSPPNITQNTEGGGNGLANNGFELLSSQISNWLGKISNDFDLGFNYRPGDRISNQEIELALSTQLFHDRVSVSSNLGVAMANNSSQTTNYIGDVRVEYKITKDGKVKLFVYNESNDRRVTTTTQSPYTQGVGLVYQEEFDNWDEFIEGMKSLFTKPKENGVAPGN